MLEQWLKLARDASEVIYAKGGRAEVKPSKAEVTKVRFAVGREGR